MPLPPPPDRARPAAAVSALLVVLPLLTALLLVLAERPALAQIPGTGALAPPAAEAGPDPAEIGRLLGVLENPERRAELVRQLRALQSAQEAIEAREPAGGLGTRLLGALSDRVEDLGDQIGTAGQAVLDAPDALRWVDREISDPRRRATWGWFVLELAMVVLVGQAARLLTVRLLRRPRATLGARPPVSTVGKLPLLVLRMALDLLPVAAFAVAGFGSLTLTDPPASVRLAGIAFLNASLMVQVVLLAARALFAPNSPNLRLIGMSDRAAARLLRWSRLIAITAIYGLFAVQTARTFGLPEQPAAALLKSIGLLIALMLVALIVQSRRSVARRLRGEVAAVSPDSPRKRHVARTGQVLRAAGRRLAGVWHVVAIVYIVVAFGIWALEIGGGFEFLLRATVVSALTLGGARLIGRGITEGARSLRAGLVTGGGPAPWFVARGQRYVGPLARALRIGVGIAAVGLVLDAWGVPVTEWMDSAAGQRVAASVLSILLVLGIALVLWEVASAAVDRYLAATDANGTAVERSARTRTLLPLLRNALLIMLTLLVGLTTLSELGMDIAPLLAGAGVIGLAIGFGSQTLVKDVITGLFILFEDTISVGDVVNVGGLGGLVEGITIRTIRLRDFDGTVHTVPFSAVTSISNMTKDFSFYVFDVAVSYKEDPERVAKVLQELGAELQADPRFRPLILAPLEIFGVDSFRESAIVIKARIKTRPIQQWNVGREFNGRMKTRFQALGIEIPYPQRTLHIASGPRPPMDAAAVDAAAMDRDRTGPNDPRKVAAE